ncbi:hypothetical protein [Paenibacillus naphthalenovorans]|uniref:hypothetical protein n=1 Tax=Paenibacillus naphthalenovorans TaxID=162209 RepID=UPI003D2C4267
MSIPKVNVQQLLKQILPLYHSFFVRKISHLPPVMLWGPPGVGKSDTFNTAVHQLSEQIGDRVGLIDLRLLLFNPVDLRGIPVPDPERQYAKWLQLDLLPREDRDGRYGILLLDEITAAAPSVQAAAYQLTLNRKLGEYTLPDGWAVAAAGNRLQDKAVVYKMPSPLANRMVHFEVVPDLDSWKEWAIPFGVSELIIAFLNYRGGFLFQFDPAGDTIAFPSPRSWSFADTFLKLHANAVQDAYPLIASAIGEAAAAELRAFAKVREKMPDIEAILQGKEVTIPREPDVLYALCTALAYRVSTPQATEGELLNLFHFFKKLRSMNLREFEVLTVMDILKFPGMKSRVGMLKEGTEWLLENHSWIVRK